jgi:hypothetical protein
MSKLQHHPHDEKKQWIETQSNKDAIELRHHAMKMQREYAQIKPQFITSNPVLRENKAETADFFSQFYRKITEHELDVYNHLTMTQWNDRYTKNNPNGYNSNNSNNNMNTSLLEPMDNYASNINFKIERINGSVVMPRPKMLEVLSRNYESSGSRTNHEYRFIPQVIYTYIRENAEWWLQFKYHINNRDITLHFVTFPDSKISVCSTQLNNGISGRMCAQEIAIYQTYAYKVFLWLTMISQMADKECSGSSLNVYFYMTPFKKNIPAATPSTREEDTLSAIHVNTGVTRNCENNGEIVIYRFEEWFKVFVHESMHNFNMDFIDTDLTKMNERLREAFCIPHGDILLFESYTETWARIINTMFESYFDPNVRNQTAFIHNVRDKLEQNAIFSTFQMTKVLELMELRYAHITIRSKENELLCRKQYKEDSNIYAYYILGGLLSVYALPFISWCIHNNRHTSASIKNKYRRNHIIDSIRFLNVSNGEMLYNFVDFMREAARDSEMLSLVAFCEKQLSKNLSSIHNNNRHVIKASTDAMRIATTLRMTI